MTRIARLLDLKLTTWARLEEYQKRSAAHGESKTCEDILEGLVETHLPMPKPVRVRKKPVKSVEPMNERQRRNARKRWAKVGAEERSQIMRDLASKPWTGTPEERRHEMQRRRALWTPRPPKTPKPSKVKLEGKREHLCREHDRDYRQGRGLFGKWHGVFPQSEHTRGRTG